MNDLQTIITNYPILGNIFGALTILYGILFIAIILDFFIYGDFPKMKWEYFIPLLGLLLFITDEY